jgi:hypothetical protein
MHAEKDDAKDVATATDRVGRMPTKPATTASVFCNTVTNREYASQSVTIATRLSKTVMLAFVPTSEHGPSHGPRSIRQTSNRRYADSALTPLLDVVAPHEFDLPTARCLATPGSRNHDDHGVEARSAVNDLAIVSHRFPSRAEAVA